MPAYKGPRGEHGDGKQPVADRDRLATIANALWTERQSGFDAHWRELGDFFMPRRTRFWVGDRNRGDKRNQNIIDSTGRFAARTLASGLHAGLTSPARPWMKLTTPSPELAKQADVKRWLHEVTERMLVVFAVSNLYNCLPLVYGDMGIFATGAMAMIADPREVFRCYTYPIGSYALGQDARGKTSTFVRRYELTVEQVVEEFGVSEDGNSIDWSRISAAVKSLWDQASYSTAVPITWIVTPNRNYDRSKLSAKFKPFVSCHYEEGSTEKTFLRESGFDTFPIMAPRWDITGEDSYGTDCPGMTALGDVKQLQVMQRRKGQLLAKAVDPPLVGPPELRTQKTSLLPGDITYLGGRDGIKGLGPIHEVRLEGFQHLTMDVREVQYRVQRAFFEDLFLMLATSRDMGTDGVQPITAREVDERHEEKLLALGPVLERTNDELLDPLVDRAYALMDAAGLIPPPPSQLEGVDLKVEYVSILAEAQKLVGVVGQDRFMQSTAGLIEVFPEIRHKVNVFKVVDNYGDMLGVDPQIVRSDEEARASLQQEQEAQQRAEAAANAAQLAKAAKDASAAPLTGDTVLAAAARGASAGIPPVPVGQPPAAPVGQ
jgi:hypothetical protein